MLHTRTRGSCTHTMYSSRGDWRDGDRRRGLLVISRASRISISAREMPESSWNARQAATRDRCLCRCPLTHRNGTRMTPSVVFLNPQLAPLDATRSPQRAPSPLSIYSPPPTRLPVGVRVAIRAEQITQAECHRARRGPRRSNCSSSGVSAARVRACCCCCDCLCVRPFQIISTVQYSITSRPPRL